MRKYFLMTVILFLLFMPLSAKIEVNEGDSVVEFPVIVIAGQIVEVTPFSIIFENTFEGTDVTDEQIKKMVEYYSSSVDFRAHGFANALKVVSVKDGKMRVAFYLDNILKVFDDDIRTYMRFIPIYFLFKSNIQSMKIPKKVVEELKKHSLEYYLDLPMAKELMSKSWLAGVFRINPDTKKLIYQGARFFNDFEEMESSEWANEYRIPGIVKKGMVLSMTKAVVVGRESKDVVKEDKDKEKEKGTKKGSKDFWNKKYDGSGQGK